MIPVTNTNNPSGEIVLKADKTQNTPLEGLKPNVNAFFPLIDDVKPQNFFESVSELDKS